MNKHPSAENLQDAAPVGEPKTRKPKPKAAKRTCIMVLGMHRSGTSALTRAISLLGAELPKNLLPPAPNNNERGFWEPAPLVELHERMLAEGGSQWDDWRGFDIANLSKRRVQHYKAEIARLLVDEFCEAELFVLKEPRVSRFVPLYADILKAMKVDVRYVLVSRNPLAVAASLQKRDRFTLGFSSLLWLRHELDAESATRGKQRVLVSYEDMMAGWRPTLAKIVDELDLAWPRSLNEAAIEIDRNLSEEHRHHVASTAQLIADERISVWVKEAYAALKALADNEGDKVAIITLDRVKAELDAVSAASGDAFFSELDTRLKVSHENLAGQRQLSAQRASEIARLTAERDQEAAQAAEREAQFAQNRQEWQQQIELRDNEIARARLEHEGATVQVARREAQFALSREEWQRQIEQRDTEIAKLAAEREQAKETASALRAVVAQIHASHSWIVTRPLRVMARLFRGQVTLSALIRKAFGPSVETHVHSTSVVPRSRFASILYYLRIVSKEAVKRIRTPRDAHVALKRVFKALDTGGPAALLSDIRRIDSPSVQGLNYTSWISQYDALSDHDIGAVKSLIRSLPDKPLISIVMPVYNTSECFLREAIESVLAQHYEHWELCIADDASTDGSTVGILREYAERDSRIKLIFRPENGHISRASNSAISLCTGKWIAFLDHDDTLAPHALVCVAKALADYPDARLLYSDEDKINENGERCDPYFKSDWNLDLFRSHNLITHLGVYFAQTIRDIGGCRPGFEGAQDYDLALRFTEVIKPEQIVHIPHVLYHWRSHAGSTAKTSDSKPYAMLAGERALNEHLKRVEPNGVAKLVGFGFSTRYSIATPLPLVSVIIPTRDAHQLVRTCVDSITKLTTYRNFEIILIDNGSTDPDALQYFSQLSRDGVARVIRDDGPFNFSRLNNAAVEIAAGEVIALLNNDIEVIAPDWLTEMVEHALRPGIGAVGARLLYPNGTLQHGGIVMGLGGLAAHAHHGFDRWSPGYIGRAALSQNFAAVTGACLVVTKANYALVDGLNETDLAVAYNDVDFCLRLREAGLRNIWVPGAELFHHESATRGYEETPEKLERFAREQAYMLKRWPEIIAHDPYYSLNLTLDRGDFSIAFPPRAAKPWKALDNLC
ncbi:glycosyltransferase [Mesorhizobium sp. dw_380]|uniref:glycosyltransferase n=1 Tax=Mesorhizobium sp. dw_380 TaxID=2812001 RepID=UPI001BDF02D9|nr:glycosyltransferase [Mesorhizobium sp. dw_380]